MRPEGGEGWYISSEGKQIGPLTAGDVLARVMTGGLAVDDLVWHPSMQGWRAAGEVFSASVKPSALNPPPDAARWLLTPEIQIRNSSYLMGLFAGLAACFIMMLTALLSDEASITLFLFAIFAALGWWSYLECCGTRLLGASLIFPTRPPFWPYLPAYRMTTIALDRIVSTRVFSNGRYSHGLVLGLAAGQASILFDDPFLRDLTLAAILARSTNPAATF